jgi:hypothetical protein
VVIPANGAGMTGGCRFAAENFPKAIGPRN